MKKIISVVLLLFLATFPSFVFASEENENVTIVNFFETSETEVYPDRVVARLTYIIRNENVVEAQSILNRKMAKAVKMAQKIKGIKISTSSYNVYEVYNKKNDDILGWEARQTLKLKGQNVEDVLELVGKLQEKGMVSAGVSYFISNELINKTKKELTQDIISLLKNKMNDMKKHLGVRYAKIKEISFDNTKQSRIMNVNHRLYALSNKAQIKKRNSPVSVAEEQKIKVSLSAKVEFSN